MTKIPSLKSRSYQPSVFVSPYKYNILDPLKWFVFSQGQYIHGT